MIKNYNIHNLVTIETQGRQKKALALIDKHYRLFNADKNELPDIKVVADKFEADIKDYTLLDNKYFVKGDSLFCKDNHKIAKWRVWIKNLEGQTQVFFDGDPFFSHLFLFKYILEPIVFYKLSHKGISFIHSSCVGNDKGAYIFSATKGVGKTSTALRLANNNMQFFSDEYTLLSKDGIVYSYPNCIHMHYYNLVSAPFLRKRLKLTDMAIILVYELIRILSLKSANFPHNLQMKAIFPHMSFVRKSQLVSMLFLKKVHSKASEIKPVEPQTLIERIPIINYFEMPHFENYLLALSFSDTTGNIKKYRDRLISNLQCVRSVLCYDVEIPQDYNEDSFLAISKLLGSY